jgi:hypothetical protein
MPSAGLVLAPFGKLAEWQWQPAKFAYRSQVTLPAGRLA